MMKNYENKAMSSDDAAPAGGLVCVRECVTPGIGRGTWIPGDEVHDGETVAALIGSPFFKKKAEVK